MIIKKTPINTPDNKENILKKLIYNLIKSCIVKWIQNTHSIKII